MAESRAPSAAVDYCFTAPGDHLPRIQEAHATTWHALLSVVQEELVVMSGPGLRFVDDAVPS